MEQNFREIEEKTFQNHGNNFEFSKTNEQNCFYKFWYIKKDRVNYLIIESLCIFEFF